MSFACPSFMSEQLCRPIDHYCERTGPEWYSEPVNALTNLAFLVAGYFAWRLHAGREAKAADGVLVALIVVIPIVGIGSLIFHTFATRWLEWGDVFPILVYMLLYLWLVLRRFLAWPRWAATAFLVVFLVVTVLLEARVPGDVLWGGAMYLPTILALVGLGIALRVRHPKAGYAFFIATGIFLLSFASRTVDAGICLRFPLGTHFMWHLLNALLLFLLARVAILHAPAPESGESDHPATG